MKNDYIKTTLVIFSILSGLFSLKAQNTVTVYPQEYSGGLCNPLKGFRKGLNNADNENYPYTAIVRHYIKWNELENSSKDDVQKIIDYCNDKWQGLEELNVKVIPRVYIEWHDQNGDEYWPADIVDSLGWDTWDNRYWKSDLVKNRVVKLIHKLGEAWDYDPRVAWIQTGLIGYWGEQENPVGVDEEGWSNILGDAFQEAFKNKKLLVRNQDDWSGDRFGVYWDSYGHPGQRNGSWKTIQNKNAQGRYLSEVIEGEVAYNWGEDKFDPLYGGEPEITLNDTVYTNNMIDVIRELHCTGLGWISDYDLDGSFNTNPENLRANASKMQKEFGYRFVIPEFSITGRSEPGDSIHINFKVVNKGSAPFYEDWPLVFVLINESNKEIVYTQELPEFKISNWLPGTNYNYNSRSYLTPAIENEINASIKIPDTIETGMYMAGITILEPHSKTPGIFFSMRNFLAISQTQPLCRIGVGMDLTGSHEIDSSIYDDPLQDDKRKYTLDPIGPTYSLNIEPSQGGNVKPGSREFEQNRTITVRATPEVGYIFTGWSGDLSGNENPIKITMDSNKTIKANFSAAPPEILPWFETFNINDGSTSNVGPTSWLATRSGGKFEVDYQNRLMVNDAGDPGVFSTGNIDISQDTVVISMDISGAGGLDESGGNADFIRIYTVIDGGNEELIYEHTGKNPDQLYVKNITGNTLRLIIRTKVTASDEFYFFDNLLINYDTPENNYLLTTNATNGSISLSPPGGSYEAGLTITLTAVPDNGFRFAGWSGDLSGSENPGTLEMNGDKIVTAHFEAVPTYSLTTHIENGSIKLNPDGGIYQEGTVVTIVVNPDVGFVFTGWKGDLTHHYNPTTIAMDGNKEITAIIQKIQAYTLSVNATYGSVLILPEKDIYTPGSAVVLKATPDEGYEFSAWEGSLSGNANPTSIIMNEDKTITAVFLPSTALSAIIYNEQTVMLQNYPNPFSTETTIQYYLNQPSNVKLSIYNFLGQKVTILKDEYQFSGEHQVKWKPLEENLKMLNGLYLYCLEIDNDKMLVKKASFIK